MYAARSSEAIPYVLDADRENAVKTQWHLRAHKSQSAQAYGLRRDKESRRDSVPPEERAEILTKLDQEFLAAALVRIDNWAAEGDSITEQAEIRAIIEDLDLPTIVELNIMSQSTMRLKAAEKNS